jgi:hypothetical protein
MDSQRWVSDMRSHHALRSAPGASEAAAVDSIVDNVVPLFAPREGTLAALVAAASAPGELRELAGESEARAIFRAAMLDRPRATTRRHRLAPLAIAAGSVAGLVAGTAGLSAAAVLPPAANHVMAQVLRQVGINVAPTPGLGTGTAAVRTSSLPAPTTAAPKAPAAKGSAPLAVEPTPTHGQPRIPTAPACTVSTVSNSGLAGQVLLPTAIAFPPTAAAATPETLSSVNGQSRCTTTRGAHHAKGAAKGSTPTGLGPTTGTGGGSSGTGTGGSGSSGPGTGSGSGGGTTTGKGTNHGGTGTGKHGGHHGHKGGGTGTCPGTGSGSSPVPTSGTGSTTTVPATSSAAPCTPTTTTPPTSTSPMEPS